MTWASFVEYVQMREAGKTDTVYRSYDLTRHPMQVDKVAKMLGLDVQYLGLTIASLGNALFTDVLTKLRNYNIQLDVPKVARYLHEWYHWHRLSTGKIRRLPYRKAPLD